MRVPSKVIVAFILFALAAGQQAICERPRRPSGRTTQAERTTLDKRTQEVMPNFTGVLKTVGKNTLTLDNGEANSIEFNCTKKTKFYDGSKSIKLADLKTGGRLSVEAVPAPDGSLDAVNVRIVSEKQQQ